MNTEQKLAQAETLVSDLEDRQRPFSAEIVRGLIALVRELEAENARLRGEFVAVPGGGTALYRRKS